MDKQEWKAYFEPFVGQMGLVLTSVEKRTVCGSGRKGVMGSYIEQSYLHVWSFFVFESDALAQDDATVLLAKQHGSVQLSNSFHASMLPALLAFLHDRGRHFLKQEAVRLPTEFLEDPLPLERESFVRANKRDGTSTTKTLVLGSEAVLQRIDGGFHGDGMKQAEAYYALVEVSRAHPQARVLHQDDVFRAACLSKLYALCQQFQQKPSSGRDEHKLRDQITVYQDLLGLLDLENHPLVLRSIDLLHPASIPLPAPVLPSK